MASAGTLLKRAAVSQGWSLFIYNATGDIPVLNTTSDGVYITWKPGQAKKFAQYIEDSITKPSSPNDVNVTLDWMPVAKPLFLKKAVVSVIGYSTAIAILTKLIWK